jgi:hypothetical protein
MNKAFIVVLALTAGCATPTTGVVPTQDGALTVTRQGSSALTSTSDLRADALKEADTYCGGRGQKTTVIHTKETQARVFGGWPEAEIVFRCG